MLQICEKLRFTIPTLLISMIMWIQIFMERHNCLMLRHAIMCCRQVLWYVRISCYPVHLVFWWLHSICCHFQSSFCFVNSLVCWLDLSCGLVTSSFCWLGLSWVCWFHMLYCLVNSKFERFLTASCSVKYYMMFVCIISCSLFMFSRYLSVVLAPFNVRSCLIVIIMAVCIMVSCKFVFLLCQIIILLDSSIVLLGQFIILLVWFVMWSYHFLFFWFNTSSCLVIL